jgi:hypothetical protein
VKSVKSHDNQNQGLCRLAKYNTCRFLPGGMWVQSFTVIKTREPAILTRIGFAKSHYYQNIKSSAPRNIPLAFDSIQEGSSQKWLSATAETHRYRIPG